MNPMAYIRVSTNKQEVDNQKFEIDKYATSKDLPKVRYFEDVESGASAGRTGLSDMLKAARNHEFDLLIVSEMSRLTRRGIGPLFAILSELKACGVGWVSLREPFLSMEGPARELLLAIFGWVAEQERLMISLRTKAALNRRRGLGFTLGRPKGSKDKKPRTRSCQKLDFYEKGGVSRP